MSLELVTDGVSDPIHVTNAGDERLFIVGRSGTVHVFSDGALLDPAYLDIHDDVYVSGEGGLLSIAFHPDYATNGWVFVSYTRRGPNTTAMISVIERFSVSSANPNMADPTSRRLVLEVQHPFTNHKGGQILFGPDGYLYFGLGDGGGGNDPDCHAQRPNDLLGKLLRLDVDAWSPGEHYRIPADNPFTAASDPADAIRDEIWALGLRNPWRFSFDRATGDLWIGDVGQNQREEIDFAPASSRGGENYGWKVHEGELCLFQPPIVSCPGTTPACFDPRYTMPVFTYGRRVGRAITGGFVYRGSAAAHRGRYVYGDSQTGDVWALDRTGAGWESTLLTDELVAPVSFGEDAEGELYVADLGQGAVFRVRLDGAQTRAQRRCLVGMNERSAQLADTQAAGARDCAKRHAQGKADAASIDACLAADRRDRVARREAKLARLEADRCAEPPAFGYGGGAAAAAAARAAELALVRDLFGELPDEAIVRDDRMGHVVARCQRHVLDGLGDCQRARRAAFLDCKKRGLEREMLQNGAQLAQCLDSDRKGRVARACDPTTGALAAKRIPKQCTRHDVDLSRAFPGCVAGGTAEELASCTDARGRCRHCQMLQAADALEVECDLYDDGQSNESCALGE